MSSLSRRSSRREARRSEGPGRGRRFAARGAGAAGSLVLLIARVIRLIVGLAALVIAVAIILRLLGANSGNTIVHDVHDAGSWLAGPFRTLFSIHGAKLAMVVNWGIAAVVWLVVGGFIASLIARIGLSGVRRREAL